MTAPDPYTTRCITPANDEWPDRLADLGFSAPTQLWVRGHSHLVELTEQSVAVVGSRSATMYGSDVAQDLGCALAENRYTVVSGGAYGIDAAAHRGVLASRTGRTVVVLACGVDRVYPSAHESIFNDILRLGGLIVSEVELGQPPTRQRFLERNRIIAALSQGTVVVEAAVRSGAMSTARWAHRLQRPLMAVPGPITNATSAGTNALIRDGSADLVTGLHDVLERVERSVLR